MNLLQALPTIASVGMSLFGPKGPSMAERKAAIEPWRQSLDSIKDRAEMYRDPNSQFWQRQEGYLTNQILQNQDWSNMFTGRQFGGMNLPSPIMAQKKLGQNLSNMQQLPGILNSAWLKQQDKSDDLFGDYSTGMKSYGENILGFQTEDYANKRARLTDMTDTLGSLQKSDVWNNMFKKKEK